MDGPRSRARWARYLFVRLGLLLALAGAVWGQADRYDIVEFTTPPGWTKAVDDSAASLSRTDSNGQTYGAIVVLKSLPAGADSRKNFQVVWDILSPEYASSVGAPTMQPTASENGWTVESGVAEATTDRGPAAFMLVTATGGGKLVSLVVLTNSNVYQGQIDSFISSLRLPKVDAVATRPAAPDDGKVSSLPGLWVLYTTESSGVVNGTPMLTGGYFRREYLLNQDGTYRYRAKDWSTGVKDILYVQETGRWSVSGNQLTITPAKGAGGWWSKTADGRTVGWGARQKNAEYALEPVTYTFELKYLSGMGETYLILKSPRATAREGRQNSTGSGTHEYNFSRRDASKSLIDPPPGSP